MPRRINRRPIRSVVNRGVGSLAVPGASIHCADVNPRRLIDEIQTPDGSSLKLTARGDWFEVSLNGISLMSSREHSSEELMAALALQDRPDGGEPRVLVGGLGMGFTLRALLNRLGPRGQAVVVELFPAVIAWNRGPLGHLADHPLQDPRTEVRTGDFLDFLNSNSNTHSFDAILVDIDNGPESFTTATNASLYTSAGLHSLHRTLKPGGTLVVWSAFQSPSFLKQLRRAGFDASTVAARSREHGGSHHTLFVAKRPPGKR